MPDAATMPDQRSLYEQVSDLWRLAREQKMYDAQDWLATQWQGPPLPPSDERWPCGCNGMPHWLTDACPLPLPLYVAEPDG